MRSIGRNAFIVGPFFDKKFKDTDDFLMRVQWAILVVRWNSDVYSQQAFAEGYVP